MNDLSTTVDYYTELTIQSMHSDYKKSLIFFIVPKITDLVPGEIVQREKLQIPKNLKLADPYFYKPSDINMLIGAGPTLSMFCNGQITLSGGGELVLQKSKLGWIVGGSVNTFKVSKSFQCMTTNVQFDLEWFWTLEEVNISKTRWSNEDLYWEEHFKKHIKRNSKGRYIVALPFKQNAKNLGESRQIALKRLMFLEKRFKKTTAASGFYLPHHAVIKESSNATKLRVVFDASMKSTNGNSLNDNLLVDYTGRLT